MNVPYGLVQRDAAMDGPAAAVFPSRRCSAAASSTREEFLRVPVLADQLAPVDVGIDAGDMRQLVDEAFLEEAFWDWLTQRQNPTGTCVFRIA